MISGSGTLEMFKIILDIALLSLRIQTVWSYHFFERINLRDVREEKIDFIKCYNETTDLWLAGVLSILLKISNVQLMELSERGKRWAH